MNIIYTIISLVSYVILALSFKKEYGESFSYYSIIIILLRQAFRFLDLEDTKGKMSDTNWNFVLLWQITNNCSQIAILSIMFSNYKYNKVVLSLCLVLTVVCGCYGQTSSPGIKENQIMLMYIPIFLLFVVVINKLGHHFPDMIKLILQKNESNEKFK